MEIRDILAANLKQARKAKGLSQEELAGQVGIDRTYVSALERRVYAGSIDLVDRLAKAPDRQPYEVLMAASTDRSSPTSSST